MIKECTGKVAYKLQMPHEVKIHTVFHVSQLKAYSGHLPMTVVLPNWSGIKIVIL